VSDSKTRKEKAMTKKEAYELGIKLSSVESILKLRAAKMTGYPVDIPTALRYYLAGPAGTALGAGAVGGGINALAQAVGDEKFDPKQTLRSALAFGTLGGGAHLGSRLGRGLATVAAIRASRRFPELRGAPVALANQLGALAGAGAGLVAGGKLMGAPSHKEVRKMIEAEKAQAEEE